MLAPSCRNFIKLQLICSRIKYKKMGNMREHMGEFSRKMKMIIKSQKEMLEIKNHPQHNFGIVKQSLIVLKEK